MLAVQMSHGGRLLGESSLMLLSEMSALVEDIKAGQNTVEATRKLAHMAQNTSIRDAIVAAKSLPALTAIMAGGTPTTSHQIPPACIRCKVS
jgi:hypothetical protein